MVVQADSGGRKGSWWWLCVGCALEVELYFWEKKMRITKK